MTPTMYSLLLYARDRKYIPRHTVIKNIARAILVSQCTFNDEVYPTMSIPYLTALGRLFHLFRMSMGRKKVTLFKSITLYV